jgi:enoyl-[acyl-carrier-protein] reductase (NADH)
MEEAARAVRQVYECGSNLDLRSVGDASSYEAVQAGLTDVDREFGPQSVNVFIHALSGASVGSMLGIAAEKVEKTFAAMAHSFLWWAQGLYERRLLAPHATLIALSNPVAENYLAGSGVIGPAKAALEAYVKALAVELGRAQHRVCAVRFGAVATPALAAIVGVVNRLRSTYQHISPYGAMQTADDVAAFIALLSMESDATWALNGAVIDFTAGAHLTLLNHAFK